MTLTADDEWTYVHIGPASQGTARSDWQPTCTNDDQLVFSGSQIRRLIRHARNEWRIQMSIEIRRSDLSAADENLLLHLFRRYLDSDYTEGRFEWLYRENPFGQSVAWIAFDTVSGEAMGAAAAFPRKLYHEGRECSGMVFGDFCLAPSFRTLGPALQLQRACIDEVRRGSFDLFYDFPSERMTAIYKRLGIPSDNSMVRWVKILRVGKPLQRRFRSKIVAGSVARVVDKVLPHVGWQGDSRACELETLKGFCTPDFTDFAWSLRHRLGLQTAKTAAYLNWRYRDSAAGGYEILTARRSGELVGFIVFRVSDEVGYIVDLNAIEEPDIVGRLLSGAVLQLANKAVSTVHLYAVDAHPWTGLFLRAGFRKRESAPVVVSWASAGRNAALAFRSNWYGMNGERDT